MGVIKSGTNTGSFPNNFGASDSVTAAQLNAHVNDATFDTTAVDDNTIELTNSDSKLQLKDSSSKTTGVTFAKMQHISTGKVLGNASGSEGDVREIDIDTDISSVSGSDDTVPSAKATKAYIDAQIAANCIGIGQTWQDVKSSRSNNTAFQNTTGRPIQVCLSFASDGSTTLDVKVSADNSSYIALAQIGFDSSESGTTFTVPNNHYYKTFGSLTIRTWAELR